MTVLVYCLTTIVYSWTAHVEYNIRGFRTTVLVYCITVIVYSWTAHVLYYDSPRMVQQPWIQIDSARL